MRLSEQEFSRCVAPPLAPHPLQLLLPDWQSGLLLASLHTQALDFPLLPLLPWTMWHLPHPSRVTSRLYHDAEVKQARMQQRRQAHEARLQELCSAPAGGRSRSTSPHASDHYYVASRHAGSPEARRGVAGQDGGFYMRQLALLQKRAERAAQKRPSDEDSLLECTCKCSGRTRQNVAEVLLCLRHHRGLCVRSHTCCVPSLLQTVKPKINATSQSLHRSVEQLHMWDARRKLSVSRARQGLGSTQLSTQPRHPGCLVGLVLSACCPHCRLACLHSHSRCTRKRWTSVSTRMRATPLCRKSTP